MTKKQPANDGNPPKRTKATARRREGEPNLPDSELEVMRVLWEKENATAREVWLTLQASGSAWTYATVNTLLQRLEAKGLARCNRARISFVYSPKISRQHEVARRVNHLVDKLYDGKGGQLVMHLLASQRLSAEERVKIQELLGKGSAKKGR